jgi:hypothetical protein
MIYPECIEVITHLLKSLAATTQNDLPASFSSYKLENPSSVLSLQNHQAAPLPGNPSCIIQDQPMYHNHTDKRQLGYHL